MSAPDTAIGTTHLDSVATREGSSHARELPADQLVDWLRQMLLIREFEVRTMQAYQNRKIGGFCHVYIGQEAVAVGSLAALRPDDPVVTAYRDHGHALARGMDPKYCMAEMYGKVGGCAKGKGGSMHMFDRDNHLYGGHGIVAAQTPLGTGLAFATKYMDEVIDGGESSHVTLCFLGDGALNQGALHEAKNLAGLYDLPVIYVVENNGYSMGTSIHRGTTMAHAICEKAKGYGMLSREIDGMDVLNVYDDFKSLVDEVRSTSQPAFVDVRTYRFKGHSMSDPRKYRTRDEEQVYEAGDPIAKIRDFLFEAGHINEDSFTALNKEIKKEVRECVKWAEASPEPDPAHDLYHDVFVNEFGPYTGTSLPEMCEGHSDNKKGVK